MRNTSILFITIFVLLFGACKSAHEKVLKSTDINYKLEKANEYYDQKKWYKASAVYETLMPTFRGTKNYEQLYYRYCYAFYYQEDYLSASYQFKNFIENFPKSPLAEECEFMHATCLFKMSQKFSLDQTSTYKAMDALQTYISMHPNSKRLTEANNYIEIGRAKIEMKDANSAKLYFNIGQYKAATVAYKSLLENYPDSKSLDLYHFMIMKSFYKYASASVLAKQEERFSEAVSAYKELESITPKSSYLSEAEKYYTSAQNNIKKLRNEHK